MSKVEKEAFVSGLEGTSPFEILLVLTCIPIGVACYQTVPLRSGKLTRFFAEIATIWLPMVLCQSNLLYSVGLPYLLVEVIICMIARDSSARNDETQSMSTFDPRAVVVVTVYRSSLLFLTFVAILAVDFHVFPRRFAKTEISGYSLMDLGAASFSVAAGMVSPRARNRPANGQLRRAFPLLILGFLRLITHKGIEYQEHVSEYGVHWNFSFTLAMLIPMGVFLPGPSWILPTLCMMVYQYALSIHNIQSWIERAPRTCPGESGWICDAFFANREGILGCIGYTSLYLFSEWIGRDFVWRSGSTSSKFKTLLLSLVFGLVWGALQWFAVPVSRRSTNISFCAWVLFVNTTILFTIQLIFLQSGAKVPAVLGLVNRQGLSCFVGANLLTGLINLSINTLEQPDTIAFGILVAYLAVVGLIAYVVDEMIAKRHLISRKLKST